MKEITMYRFVEEARIQIYSYEHQEVSSQCCDDKLGEVIYKSFVYDICNEESRMNYRLIVRYSNEKKSLLYTFYKEGKSLYHGEIFNRKLFEGNFPKTKMLGFEQDYAAYLVEAPEIQMKFITGENHEDKWMRQISIRLSKEL